eukprot:2451642-Prymnesium_polylepis.1
MTADDYIRFEHDQQGHEQRSDPHSWGKLHCAALVLRLNNTLEGLTNRRSSERRTSDRGSRRLSTGWRRPTMASIKVPASVADKGIANGAQDSSALEESLAEDSWAVVTEESQRTCKPQVQVNEAASRSTSYERSRGRRNGPGAARASTRRASLNGVLQQFSTSGAKEPPRPLSPLPAVERLNFAQFVQLLLTPENSAIDAEKTGECLLSTLLSS